jgi:hypothetical protein
VASATKKNSIKSKSPHQINQKNRLMQPIIMIPDDNLSGIIAGIQHPPKMCIDYLSHEWTKEDDIWTSWKVMSKQKKAFANGIRLENASWRTWAKQKYNLKTVSPEKLNWLKDSDVTWLYGPLHTAWSNHIEHSPKLQTTEDKLNLMPSLTKSCLKRRTITEILRPTFSGRFDSLITSNSDTQMYIKQRENDSDLSDCETSSTCSSTSGPTTPTAGPTKSILLPIEEDKVSLPSRKIQFNDCVEQYIAVESDEDVDELHDSDQESIDDGIVMKDKKRDCSTICKLAPTKLKEDRIHNNEYSVLYSNHGRRRATTSTSASSSSSSSSSTVPSSSSTTSTTTTYQSWMDDDDDDDMDLDLIDFEPPTIQTSQSTLNTSQYHSGRIISSSSALNENHNHFQEEDDDYIEKAVNIATGVRDIVHWVFRGRIF